MGRKKKEKVGSFDRIGEEVNLEKCPECAFSESCPDLKPPNPEILCASRNVPLHSPPS